MTSLFAIPTPLNSTTLYHVSFSSLYELKVHRDSPRHTYLGYTIAYSQSSSSPCMTLSMPNYIPAMLSHLYPSGCAIYTSPASHTGIPSPSPPSTLSPPVSPAEKTWIQRVVGSLLFYARALDLSILTAVCQLSSYQSIPPNWTLPPLTAFSTMSPLTPTPKKLFTLPPWLSDAVLTPASCPDLTRAA
jgi:hypothetical protein